jgi:lysyl-tRNA synthetase class 2
MKRLLGAGFGSIFQICKSFRKEEQGRLHNSEFTMLEWYRIGFDHHQLMSEVIELLQVILNLQRINKITYKEIFYKYFNLDPLVCTIENLKQKIIQHNINLTSNAALNLTKADYFDLLFSHIIQPNLESNVIWVIYDYPVEQSALAKINRIKQPVAERFEVFINGVELANGYHELQDVIEQKTRFANDLAARAKLQLNSLPIDTKLIKALEYGLPHCSGVALGLDRLLMIKLNSSSITEVIPFALEI